MLPIHHIENFLKFAPPHLQEIVLELRNVIFSAAPDTAEVVRWGGLSYFHEVRRDRQRWDMPDRNPQGTCPLGVYPRGVFA